MGIVVNGKSDSGEWSTTARLDYAGASPAGYALYGTVDGNSLVFSLQSAIDIGLNTTVWLNTDHNTATGYPIFSGLGAGADFNVTFVADATGAPTPYLYTGASAQTFVGAITEYAFSADHKTVEFRVPLSQLGLAAAPAVTQVYADVNNTVFLPGDYSLPPLTLANPASLPKPSEIGLKVGIVYSETSAARYFDKTAYADLFMAAQNQAMMAGVPYDILTEADLTNVGKLANYDTLIFPSFTHVPLAKLSAIQETLELAVYEYGIGIISAGNFMTNDETGAALPGNSYTTMKMLLGLDRAGGANLSSVKVAAQDVTHPAMSGYTAGETIRDYASIGTQWFTSVTPSSSILATQTVGGVAHEAVIATTTGGRNVHFATEGMLADNNMLAHALDWTAKDAALPSLKLQMSRQSSIFASRNDMDQAMEPDEVRPATGLGIYDKLLPILEKWKQEFNFVGSYYIDIGDGTNGTGTNWAVSKPYYERLLAMGNEIGSHSITHPENTNLLTVEQLRKEFQESKAIIEQQLGIVVQGAAIPGMPEKLPVSQEVMKYYSYLTGGNTLVGAGYPGAFGYMTPGDTSSVYLAPNISSDFTLVGFKGLTPEQATLAWQAEWREMTSHADLPVIVFPWHDYGPTDFAHAHDPSHVPGRYNEQMFTDFIRTAYQAGSEFVTLADLAQRISAFEKASLDYSMVDADTIRATVGSTGSLGTFALDLPSQYGSIRAVTGWYAYDNDSVFLPVSGGTFNIDLGPVADDVTHITTLASRAQLLSVKGDGRALDFSISGEGQVVIDLAAFKDQAVQVTGATVTSLAGERLEVSLAGLGQHNVSIRYGSGQTIAGDAAANKLTGGSGTDVILGLGGNDTLTGAVGNDVLNGGDGLDTAIFNGARSAFTVSMTSTSGSVVGTGTSEIDTLISIERLQFTDGTLALDTSGNAGQAYRLYQAAFARTPDIAGIKFQTTELDTKLALWQVASNFIASPEFQGLYGTPGNVSDSQFVTLLYNNVLKRAPEQAGFDYHVGNLSHGFARHDLLIQFSESPENQANVAPAIKDGIWLG